MTTTAAPTTLALSPEQADADREFDRWYDGGDGEFSMGGYAGTGKTTLIGYWRSKHPKAKWKFLTPTGKAAHVLKTKGVPAETIHSFIYTFMGQTKDEQGRTVPVFDARLELDAEPPLVVVDESSMVNDGVARDLRSHGLRILWVGDHGQLPPIGGDPGIMRNPRVRLEQIMRQAAESPILRIAHHVRKGGHPRDFVKEACDDLRVVRAPGVSRTVEYARANGFDQILCAFNVFRNEANAEYRRQSGFMGLLNVGEKIICLLNNHQLGLMNGMTLTVTRVTKTPPEDSDIDDDRVIWADVTCDDGTQRRNVPLWTPAFGRGPDADEIIPKGCVIADYGYCITTHKAQGSEWSRVMVVDQDCRGWDMNRWRYTAYTRAKKRLVVIVA